MVCMRQKRLIDCSTHSHLSSDSSDQKDQTNSSVRGTRSIQHLFELVLVEV